jgi:hypothetical protein
MVNTAMMVPFSQNDFIVVNDGIEVKFIGWTGWGETGLRRRCAASPTPTFVRPG